MTSALIGSGFRRGIDLAERQPIHLTRQRLRDMGGGVGGAEMHGMAAAGEHHRDGRRHRGLAHAAFAHGHDDAMSLLFDRRPDRRGFPFPAESKRGLMVRRGCVAIAVKQDAEPADAEDIDRPERDDKGGQAADEGGGLRQGGARVAAWPGR